MKKKINQILTLAQILATCKVTDIKNNKEKFAIVRLMNNIVTMADDFEQKRQQATSMFTKDDGTVDNDSFTKFLNDELEKEQDIPFEGISYDTYEQLCNGSTSLNIGQMSFLSILVKE